MHAASLSSRIPIMGVFLSSALYKIGRGKRSGKLRLTAAYHPHEYQRDATSLNGSWHLWGIDDSDGFILFSSENSMC